MPESKTPRIAEACEVPFIERLRSVPSDYRATYAIQWNEDGRETGHRMVPVGHMMHQAADELEAARQEIADQRSEIEEWQGTVAIRDKEIAELRERVIEEAAAECDKLATAARTLWEDYIARCTADPANIGAGSTSWHQHAESCAAAIRALKRK